MKNQVLSIVSALILTGCLTQTPPPDGTSSHSSLDNGAAMIAPNPDLVDLLNITINDAEDLEAPEGALSDFCEYEYDYHNEFGTHEPISCSYDEGEDECCAWMFATDTEVCGEVWCMKPDTCLWELEFDSCGGE